MSLYVWLFLHLRSFRCCCLRPANTSPTINSSLSNIQSFSGQLQSGHHVTSLLLHVLWQSAPQHGVQFGNTSVNSRAKSTSSAICPLHTTHGSTRSYRWCFRHSGPESQSLCSGRSQQGLVLTSSPLGLHGITTSF